MSRSTDITAHDLWREWKHGLGGGPSVESLESRYGAKWRATESDRQFFNRRKKSLMLLSLMQLMLVSIELCLN